MPCCSRNCPFTTSLGEPRSGVAPAALERRYYEVKLGDEFLMSSLFTVGERALATLGLARLGNTHGLEVVVGGLGLGYTAAEAPKDERVTSLAVIDALGEVINWHRSHLGPW